MLAKREFRSSRRFQRARAFVAGALLVALSLTGGGCFLDNEVEQYYGRSNLPREQVFRWSDGGLPQVFDPALAAVPPDTDAVRALFEGLTDYDPQNLSPVPGVATAWESSPDARVWTFHLRHDARWSNGEAVTAGDFVRSWKRIVSLGERAPHAKLLANVVGATAEPVKTTQPAETSAPSSHEAKTEVKKDAAAETARQPEFGAEAVDGFTLRVRLQRADKNFPALVAHPVFRPVHDEASAAQGVAVAARPISNGAFQLTQAGQNGVVLERAENYWDAPSVALKRVQFIGARDAEAALDAYKNGDVDAVTNAGFEPLALKLLAPYKDFQRATYGALTYYSFNTERAPFSDGRVRAALALSIDRERISEDQMEGATEPAKKFLPIQMPDQSANHGENARPLERDIARAQALLAEAGFPRGAGFPHVRLLVNRNEQQRVVAQTVAAMWKSALGIETDVVIKNWDDYETALREGDYDVARRGAVMQTVDEEANMRLLFETDWQQPIAESSHAANGPNNKNENSGAVEAKTETKEKRANAMSAPQILTESQALKELPAIPIYFASSYALVKPYVEGFEANLLDAPSLKRVRLNTNWKPPKKQG